MRSGPTGAGPQGRELPRQAEPHPTNLAIDKSGRSVYGNTDFLISGSGNTSFYTFQGVPAGVTLLISNLSRSGGNLNNTLTLGYSGDFTSD